MSSFEAAGIIGKLAAVNWDFPGSSTPALSVHSLGAFPGNFIPQIPSYLIEILSHPGDLICDPFCGSGTSGLEALRLDRRFVVSDVNPVALAAAVGKLDLVAEARDRGDLLELVSELSFEIRPGHGLARYGEMGLSEWYHPETLHQLFYIWEKIATHSRSRRILVFLFYQTLFSCAAAASQPGSAKKRRHHWGWIADNVKPRALQSHSAISIFRALLADAITVQTETTPRRSGCGGVVRADARALPIKSDTVDCVITSPPYNGMIDYTLAHRLIYMWEAWNMQGDFRLEIGARRRRNRAAVTVEYKHDMAGCIGEMHRVLKTGGFCAIVIGASRMYPALVSDVTKMFCERLRLFWGPELRAPTRRRVSDRLGQNSEEYIIVFQK